MIDCKAKEVENYSNLSTARILLSLGGIFGAHRIYLKQYPEAFIYLSTFGGFLIAIFYDTLYLHQIVEEYNNKILNKQANENERYYNTPRRLFNIIPWNSILFLLAQVSYGIWIGTLFLGLKTMLKFEDDLFLSTAISIAIGVSFGVYIMGNTGSERRDLLPIWCASFALSFLCICILDLSYFNTLVFTSIAGTAMGNKVKLRNDLSKNNENVDNSKEFSFKHFLFWTFLFSLLLFSLYLGVSETILNRRIRVGKSFDSRTIRNIAYNFIMSNHGHNNRLFLSSIEITYLPSVHKNSKINGLFKVGDNDWTSSLTVFIVDVVRAISYKEFLVKGKNYKEDTIMHPMFWAFNRMFVLKSLEQKIFENDNVLMKVCEKTSKEYEKTIKFTYSMNDSSMKRNYKNLNTKKCCDNYTSFLKAMNTI
ncbi:TM2 domain-containing protein [Strongyloides ratti]|uniref:TM2 domain-containing protein n=1 Tax=Strongyloides ratti TaxID=34506 RepID=A0A090MXX0_STRRB|nr:TM2 domain-containing protein [Strongyloides ratti]CEF66169.1 TM2 domain-containing protein [Strongyloides ratti]